LIDSLKGQDPYSKEIAGAIILLFQQQIRQDQRA